MKNPNKFWIFCNDVLDVCILFMVSLEWHFICHESNVVDAGNLCNLLLTKAMHQGLQITSVCEERLLLLFPSFTKGNDAIQWRAALLKWQVSKFSTLFIYFFKDFLDNISPFCVETDTPVLDFWWRLSWVPKQGGSAHLRALSRWLIVYFSFVHVCSFCGYHYTTAFAMPVDTERAERP